MGMNYYIVPNKQTNCENNFGNGLSFFFEQIGGYGEAAEVEQVSKILSIDLSVFQDVEYDPEDTAELKNIGMTLILLLQPLTHSLQK